MLLVFVLPLRSDRWVSPLVGVIKTAVLSRVDAGLDWMLRHHSLVGLSFPVLWGCQRESPRLVPHAVATDLLSRKICGLSRLSMPACCSALLPRYFFRPSCCLGLSLDSASCRGSSKCLVSYPWESEPPLGALPCDGRYFADLQTAMEFRVFVLSSRADAEVVCLAT
ncbi:hypothetical protein Nepgr_033607 [Nepenthes gracilis]|uniref:Uncharacterized protein n=1 Tax=Nepenthes gracilis TaxID=150966 RepID=A0AAD3TML7_NEPGR|nr:hypothetical protein Nepgr_033607 [Nepenthes gracilis]